MTPIEILHKRKEICPQPRVDLTGRRFGRLKVISRHHREKGGQYLWECICDCGEKVIKRGNGLQSGNTKSCGCYRAEIAGARFRTHSSSSIPEYRVWLAMRRRCIRPQAQDFADYGGRGITVCDEWVSSFEFFMGDMGRRPSSAYSIERLNNDGNYEPTNCIWATRSEQVRNRRPLRLLQNVPDTELIAEVVRRGLQKNILQLEKECSTTITLELAMR